MTSENKCLELIIDIDSTNVRRVSEAESAEAALPAPVTGGEAGGAGGGGAGEGGHLPPDMSAMFDNVQNG